MASQQIDVTFSSIHFFGILIDWIVSVVNRVSNKNIQYGLTSTIILMSSLMFLKLIKYNVLFNPTVERYVWYAYYIPQCLAPTMFFLTVLAMARKEETPLSAGRKLFFLPAILLIVFVFTNDLHEQVFSFPNGLENANKVYQWEWGYYLTLSWIAGLYLTSGILLFIKCRISHCRKKAFIPLTLFLICLACCIVREVFNPSFIKMPETVVFSVVIVSESLIRIGLIPSNTEYAQFFDMADVSAMILNHNQEIELISKKAPSITHNQVIDVIDKGEITLSKDVVLKAKPITGGNVLWTEDMSVINKINDELAEINETLAEEIDIVTAENRMKEQRFKIEEQNKLYRDIFDVAKPRLEKISQHLNESVTKGEKDDALRQAVIQGVFLKRRSNFMLMKNEEKISLIELLYALKEVTDALTFIDVYSSVFLCGEGYYPIEQIELIFECFEDCIELALPHLRACLVRLSAKKNELSCRIFLDSGVKTIATDWRKEDRDKLGASLILNKSDNTLYVTLSFLEKEEQK